MTTNSPLEQNVVEILSQVFTAIGTVAVAVAAIWGGWLRARLAPAKVSIEAHNLRGKVTNFTGGKRAVFYHLKVVNHRSWAPARNCRVVLREVTKRSPGGDFLAIPYSVPMPFVWAPAELTPPTVSIVKEQVVDFGFLAEGDYHFMPRLYAWPNDFQGFVAKDEAVRYYLEVVSDDFVSSQPFVVEVAWDGVWSDNLDVLSSHLVVKEAKA